MQGIVEIILKIWNTTDCTPIDMGERWECCACVFYTQKNDLKIWVMILFRSLLFIAQHKNSFKLLKLSPYTAFSLFIGLREFPIITFGRFPWRPRKLVYPATNHVPSACFPPSLRSIARRGFVQGGATGWAEGGGRCGRRRKHWYAGAFHAILYIPTIPLGHSISP